METAQVVSMLRWVNETDPRVMFNEASVEVWAFSMAPLEAGEAKQAVLEHYKANETYPANPATIRKRGLAIRASRAAGQSAIEAKHSTAPRHPLGWRARNPEEWDRLFKQGQIEGNETRRLATEARAGTAEPSHESWMAA